MVTVGMDNSIQRKGRTMIYIGIDTGTHTGFAVWDSKQKRLLDLETLPIHRALERVHDFNLIAETMGTFIHVVFEDARLRRWYSGDATAKMQGAGSIKRDAAIWEDFLTDYKYDFTMVVPQKGMTKMNEEYFKTLTGWNGRTSNHARDAALLVIGRH